MEIVPFAKLEPIIPDIPEHVRVDLTNCRNSIQSQLFLAFFTLLICKEKCVSVFRSEKEKLEPDFWIPQPEPIHILYSNKEAYYVPLRDLKFYGLSDATYKYKADMCFEESHAFITNRYNKEQATMRADKIWRFDLMITSPNVYGEAKFEIYAENKPAPFSDLGKINFEFRNLVINAKINIREVDNRFVKSNSRFPDPELKLKINFASISVNVLEYPLKTKPFFLNRELIMPLTTERKMEIVRDFTDKFENAKEELSERLRAHILEKVTPMILKMKTKLDMSDAFFVGMRMEPYYSRFSHKFIPPPPPPEPSRFLE